MKYKLLILTAAIFSLAACDKDSHDDHEHSDGADSGVSTGEKLFNKNCASCHGHAGKGTDQGPPFIHKIYEPNHHGDPSFVRAVQQGVQAHHWKFGDMPAIEGISHSDISEIIAYIRSEQRKAGIH